MPQPQTVSICQLYGGNEAHITHLIDNQMNACLDLMKALDQDVDLHRVLQTIAGSKTSLSYCHCMCRPYMSSLTYTAEQLAIKLRSVTQLD